MPSPEPLARPVATNIFRRPCWMHDASFEAPCLLETFSVEVSVFEPDTHHFRGPYRERSVSFETCVARIRSELRASPISCETDTTRRSSRPVLKREPLSRPALRTQAPHEACATAWGLPSKPMRRFESLHSRCFEELFRAPHRITNPRIRVVQSLLSKLLQHHEPFFRIRIALANLFRSPRLQRIPFEAMLSVRGGRRSRISFETCVRHLLLFRGRSLPADLFQNPRSSRLADRSSSRLRIPFGDPQPQRRSSEAHVAHAYPSWCPCSLRSSLSRFSLR